MQTLQAFLFVCCSKLMLQREGFLAAASAPSFLAMHTNKTSGLLSARNRLRQAAWSPQSPRRSQDKHRNDGKSRNHSSCNGTAKARLLRERPRLVTIRNDVTRQLSSAFLNPRLDGAGTTSWTFSAVLPPLA